MFAAISTVAFADQTSFTNSGGSTSGSSTGVTITGSPTTPSGTLSINCPETSAAVCAGGSLTYASSDGTSTVTASFTSGSFVESCFGGGKGGHITCYWTLTGYFSGTWTLNGVAQAVNGVTYESFEAGGYPAAGTTAFNSSYTPFYYSDSAQILRSDDLQGTNQITYGSQGGGVGQFYGAYGLALDAQGRIYVADTYNCRVVRIDDMKGTNWATYGGTCGSGQGQFYDPMGIAVDSLDRIYVLDGSNSRVVRIDDMTGTNWTTIGTSGTGVGQFEGLLAIAVDSSNRIYVVDANRLIRFDDMTGTNWTVLTQSPVVNGVSYLFDYPVAVAVDSAGKIYVAESAAQTAVIRIDDMNGDNWTSINVGSNVLNSVAVDPSGIVIAGGGGAHIVDNMAGVLNSSGSIGPVGSYYVFGVTPIPLSDPRPSALDLSPSTLSFSQNVGTTSPTQSVTVSNFGGSPLNLSNIAASAPFAITPNCPSVLTAGASCPVGVTFSPTVTGTVTSKLTFTDNSGNVGTTQNIPLTGVGTYPAVTLTPPKSLGFAPQLVGTTSGASNVTLKDSGTGPVQVTSASVTGPFSQTNTCIGTIAANASCTIAVTFAPTVAGSVSGTLTLVDNVGTQTLGLSGYGNPLVSFSVNPLAFGQVVVGSTSVTKTLTLLNNQNVALGISSVVASAGYTVVSNTCGTSVAAMRGCTVGVTFTPTAIGVANGTLTFTDDAASSPQTVTLTGTGSAPVTLSPTTLNFGMVAVGTTSAPKTVTLTNHASVALTFSSIAASAAYTVASNSCGTSIAAGAKCTVGVTFSPTTSGAASGTLTFTDDAALSPQAVSLNGTGK
jgi:hypothetical protein